MKTKRLTAIILLVAIVALAVLYVVDPCRLATRRLMRPVGSHVAKDYMLSSVNVTAIAQDSHGLVWIGTSAGINVYDGQHYVQFSHDAADTTALPDDYINCLHLDRRGRMWVGTQNGVAVYEGAARFRRFDIPGKSQDVTAIADDSTDTMSVVVRAGKCCYRVGGGMVAACGTVVRHAAVDVTHAVDSVLAKPRDIISASFTDRDGNLWLGYHNAGYQVLSDVQVQYMRANAIPLSRSTDGRDIVCLQNVGESILAGTALRLYVYDWCSRSMGFTFYGDLFTSPLSPGEKHDLLYVVPSGSDGAWLIGNRQVLACRIVGTELSVVGRTAAVGGSGESMPLLGSGVRVGDSLYVSCEDGNLLQIDSRANVVRRIRIVSRWYDEETQLATLRDGRLLLFMKNMHVAVYDPHVGTLRTLGVHGDIGCGNVDPAFVHQDSHGNVWLGTKRSGLYHMDMRTLGIKRMTFLGDVHVQALVEDQGRQLWITTLKDVVCYNPSTGSALMNALVSSSQTQDNRQFFDNSMCLSPSGDVLLGCSDGCKVLPRTALADDMASPRLAIYAMDVASRSGTKFAMDDGIADGSHFALAHDENDVAFSFFYPNYGGHSSLMYQYVLDGYDSDWHEPTYSHEAHYANLSPGNYRFRVRLVASTGGKALAEQVVEFRVRRAPWASAAAWLLYLSVVGWAIYYVNSLYLRLRTNRLRLLHEQREHEREQRTNEMNMSFFANVSHEFRNPLTIIAGPLMSLRADRSLPPSVQTTLDRVCISVNRMLRLIDQMLDFNQLETDALRLRVARVDAAQQLCRLADAYGESARVRGISLVVDVAGGDGMSDGGESANYMTWLDTDKFEKIMGNLFTNALKHTPDNGSIRIRMWTEDARLRVGIYNSGGHIADGRIADVFRHYYQMADGNVSHRYGWGTGIGLYYVKRLVGLHHGTIGVANVDGGVEFCFALPMGNDVYSEAERAEAPRAVMQLPVGAAAVAGGADGEGGDEKPRMLVVDDDVDVAQYIRSIFAADYDVYNRYSAEAALADIGDIRPDIVLSDVVMGEMSGYELCRKLKADLMTSHIPVVLITAKSGMDEQIGGLQLGAVAYVTKPFDPAYLHALVDSQLRNVLTLRRALGESTTTVEASADADVAMSAADREFMDQLYALMERRSAELELNVATVCHDLLISQSKFNYKLKQLTGDTPGTFFRKYKLNRAAQLLRDGGHTVSEVAVLTGFGTAAHFSVAFKKQFGVVPSEYSK